MQINVPVAENQALIVGGRAAVVTQFHWHASSEHTVDNYHHAMEMHFVLTYNDTGKRNPPPVTVSIAGHDLEIWPRSLTTIYSMRMTCISRHVCMSSIAPRTDAKQRSTRLVVADL